MQTLNQTLSRTDENAVRLVVCENKVERFDWHQRERSSVLRVDDPHPTAAVHGVEPGTTGGEDRGDARGGPLVESVCPGQAIQRCLFGQHIHRIVDDEWCMDEGFARRKPPQNVAALFMQTVGVTIGRKHDQVGASLAAGATIVLLVSSRYRIAGLFASATYM